MAFERKLLPRSITLVLLLSVLIASNSPAATSIGFGSQGLSSLRHDGVEYLRDGGCVITSIDLRNASGALQLRDAHGAPQRPTVQASLSTIKSEAGRYSITRAYQWGALTCAYSVSADRVQIDLDIGNRSPYTIRELSVDLLKLAPLNQQPSGGLGYRGHKAGLEGPEFFSIPYGGAKVVVAPSEIGQLVGLATRSDPGGLAIVLNTGVRSVLLATQVCSRSGGKERTRELTLPILPGRVGHYSFWLVFGGQEDSPRTLLRDLFERFANKFPPNFKWPDRRPIGDLFLAGHQVSVPARPLNPRYWRLIAPASDINSDAGRREFQTRLLQEADNTVATLKKMNAQGVVVWNIEGEEFPQSISYLGDPRHLPPEVQEAVDPFFKRFTDAGLRCGVTLRPQRLIASPSGEICQSTADDADSTFRNLDEKIQYAQKRWGCTLFYIDSNGDWNWPMDALIFRRLAAKHPDVLLIPELGTVLDYASTAPYCYARLWKCGSIEARLTYPKAFNVISLNGTPVTPGNTTWRSLVDMVRTGSILMFEGWFNAPENRAVLGIYQEAWGARWHQANQ